MTRLLVGTGRHQLMKNAELVTKAFLYEADGRIPNKAASPTGLAMSNLILKQELQSTRLENTPREAAPKYRVGEGRRIFNEQAGDRFYHGKKTPHITDRPQGLLVCDCGGVRLGRVEPTLPIGLITPRTEAPQAGQSYACSLETFAQPFLHRFSIM